LLPRFVFCRSGSQRFTFLERFLIRNRTPSHFLRCCSAEQYAVIVASPTPAALAAKAATKTATRIAALVNPKNAETAEAVTKDVAAAGSASGAQIEVVYASDRLEIEAAFATFARNRVDALLVGTDPFFYSRRLQLATLATRHAIPAIYTVREYPEAGGLMSYGTSVTEMYQYLGAYAGRILKGEKPGDLPVVQMNKFEFVINLPTARALGLNVPPSLLARADEVID
jgi:putative ABC transport system substrate-binding protein